MAATTHCWALRLSEACVVAEGPLRELHQGLQRCSKDRNSPVGTGGWLVKVKVGKGSLRLVKVGEDW